MFRIRFRTHYCMTNILKVRYQLSGYASLRLWFKLTHYTKIVVVTQRNLWSIKTKFLRRRTRYPSIRYFMSPFSHFIAKCNAFFHFYHKTQCIFVSRFLHFYSLNWLFSGQIDEKLAFQWTNWWKIVSNVFFFNFLSQYHMRFSYSIDKPMRFHVND